MDQKVSLKIEHPLEAIECSACTMIFSILPISRCRDEITNTEYLDFNFTGGLYRINFCPFCGNDESEEIDYWLESKNVPY